jgi:hypothetical protein
VAAAVRQCSGGVRRAASGGLRRIDDYTGRVDRDYTGGSAHIHDDSCTYPDTHRRACAHRDRGPEHRGGESAVSTESLIAHTGYKSVAVSADPIPRYIARHRSRRHDRIGAANRSLKIETAMGPSLLALLKPLSQDAFKVATI